MEILCRVRDIQKALEQFEMSFEKANGLTLKEAMLMCCLLEKDKSATELAVKIDLTCSNCSKIIKSVESRGYLQRNLGADDKRNMIFALTEEGKAKLEHVKQNLPEIPAAFLGFN